MPNDDYSKLAADLRNMAQELSICHTAADAIESLVKERDEADQAFELIKGQWTRGLADNMRLRELSCAPCHDDPASSRVCQRGVKSCDIDHLAALAQPKQESKVPSGESSSRQ